MLQQKSKRQAVLLLSESVATGVLRAPPAEKSPTPTLTSHHLATPTGTAFTSEGGWPSVCGRTEDWAEKKGKRKPQFVGVVER